VTTTSGTRPLRCWIQLPLVDGMQGEHLAMKNPRTAGAAGVTAVAEPPPACCSAYSPPPWCRTSCSFTRTRRPRRSTVRSGMLAQIPRAGTLLRRTPPAWLVTHRDTQHWSSADRSTPTRIAQRCARSPWPMCLSCRFSPPASRRWSAATRGCHAPLSQPEDSQHQFSGFLPCRLRACISLTRDRRDADGA
jgi:hypothetical protein